MVANSRLGAPPGTRAPKMHSGADGLPPRAPAALAGRYGPDLASAPYHRPPPPALSPPPVSLKRAALAPRNSHVEAVKCFCSRHAPVQRRIGSTQRPAACSAGLPLHPLHARFLPLPLPCCLQGPPVALAYHEPKRPIVKSTAWKVGAGPRKGLGARCRPLAGAHDSTCARQLSAAACAGIGAGGSAQPDAVG